MSKKESVVFTEDEKLVIANMVSTGVKMEKAKAKVLKSREKTANAESEKKKPLSANEKKELLIKEIEALDGEVPAMTASVAKFEEALTAAKANTDDETSDDETSDDETSDDETSDTDADTDTDTDTDTDADTGADEKDLL